MSFIYVELERFLCNISLILHNWKVGRYVCCNLQSPVFSIYVKRFSEGKVGGAIIAPPTFPSEKRLEAFGLWRSLLSRSGLKDVLPKLDCY